MSALSNAAAEQRLLGSCIKHPDALDWVVERVAASDFDNPAAGTIYSAICRVTMAGKAGSVALIEDLRVSGELDLVGGDRAITYLESKASKVEAEVVEAATTVAALAKKRDQAAAARKIAQTIADGGDPADQLAALTADTGETTCGWANLGGVLDAIVAGTHKRLEPTLLKRNDDASLLYQGRLNWIAAPPESMKSWLAKLTCVQLMEAGQPAIYLDFEESEPTSCTERIVSIALGRGHSLETVSQWLRGTPEDPSAQLFFYRASTGGLDAADRARALRLVKQRGVPFVVLDGVAAAMGSHNPPLEEDKARDVSLWLAGNVWPLVSAGAGVLCVDHTIKNAGDAGPSSFKARSPRGSGAKLAAVNGSALMAEVKQPGSAWTPGEVSIYIAKDRPGRVRVVSNGGRRLAAILHSTPQEAQGLIECTRLDLLSPEQATERDAEKRWDLIAAEQLSRLLVEYVEPVGKTELKDKLNERRRAQGGKGWRGETLVAALDFLTSHGWAAATKDGRFEMLAHVRSYKADYGDIRAADAPLEDPF